MEANTTLNEVSPVEIYSRSLATFQDGAGILASNQTTTIKAIAAGQSLLNRIQGDGMNPETDQICNDYLARINERRRQMEEARKPITQVMTAVAKLFTAEENKLDPKAAGTIPYLIQEQRNGYARQVAEEKRREDEERQRKAAKEREAVEIKAECDRRLQRYFSDALAAERSRLQSTFNAITLETFTAKSAGLNSYVPSYSYEHFNAFQHGLASRMHTPDEMVQLVASVTNGKFGEFTTEYSKALTEAKQVLIDRLPSKLIELEQMAKADVAEKERLEREQKVREEQEAARQRQAEVDRLKAAEEKTSQQAAQDSTLALFAGVAEAATAPAPETRQGFEIVVKHAGAWALMFEFWFRKEGMNLPLEKFPGKKLESIKTFCENAAHKQGEKIESPYLEYQPTYKAVNRKVATA